MDMINLQEIRQIVPDRRYCRNARAVWPEGGNSVMTIDRATAPRLHPAPGEDPSVTEPDGEEPHRLPPGQRHPSWDTAVHAAATLLDEKFGPPGAINGPFMDGMARDLAARLCAYHEIEEAVDHMPPPPSEPAELPEPTTT